MPENRKMYLQGKMYKIGFRTEEGLPFVPVQFMNEIIWSNLAKAQNLHGQEIASVTVEPNHCHMDLRCTDPETMPSFIGYFKQETAHAINRLLGRRRKTVWVEGYDSPPVLECERFLESFAYNILNPVKDGLVSHIEFFDGVSSYKHFRKKKAYRECLLISRDSIPKMNNPEKPELDNSFLMRTLRKKNKKKITLKLDFYSWKKAFPETENLSDNEAYKLLVEVVRKKKDEIENDLMIKPHSLKPHSYKRSTVNSMLEEYRPKKFGRKMICLAKDIALRVQYIAFFRACSDEARRVYQRWKKGDFSVPFPPGMFAPCMPRLANMVAVI